MYRSHLSRVRVLGYNRFGMTYNWKENPKGLDDSLRLKQLKTSIIEDRRKQFVLKQNTPFIRKAYFEEKVLTGFLTQ